MKNPTCLPILLALACAFPAAAQEEARTKHPSMMLPEIIKAMEKSPVHYNFAPLAKAEGVDSSQIADLLYPQRVQPVSSPEVRLVEGKREIVSAPCDLSCDASQQAEALFNADKFVDARAAYEAQIKLWPDCYALYAYRGDTWFFAGDTEKALPDYNRALAMNPDEAALYTFRANLYRRLGNYKESVEDLRRGLALRPHAELRFAEEAYWLTDLADPRRGHHRQ
jgi:tetratricopeptide (TPR) repeat protein